jgi:hypothetical protein
VHSPSPGNRPSNVRFRRALFVLTLGVIITLSPSTYAGKKGKRLLAGAAAVAVVVSDPLGKRRDYKPPKQPTHILESSSGNLTGGVDGAFLCFAEAKAEQNIYGADRAGAIFHHAGNLYFVPMWAYGRGGSALPAKFEVFKAAKSDAGSVKDGAALDPDRDDFWDCWSSKEWRWQDHALRVEALPQYKSPQQLAQEKYQADLASGAVLSGPNNGSEWASRARKAFSDLEAYYTAYADFWPAYSILLNRVRDTQQLPNLSEIPFQQLCDDKFDRDNKALSDHMTEDYGFNLCGSASENWFRLLSWYDPSRKDFRASSDWSRFGYYREPQRQIFSEKHAIDDWYLGSGLIATSYHYLFDFAERANMRVAGMVTGDGKKFASRDTFLSFYNKSAAEIESKLFDSVSNQRDIDINIRSWGLYPELLSFFASTLSDKDLYQDVIDAYSDELSEFIMESAAEQEYKYYFGAFALVEACRDSRGVFSYRNYITSAEFSEAKSAWGRYANSSALQRELRKPAEQDVRAEYQPTISYITEQGVGEFNDETLDFCRENYLTLVSMPASSIGSTGFTASAPSACDMARNELAEAETMDELQLAKAKVELLCE